MRQPRLPHSSENPRHNQDRTGIWLGVDLVQSGRDAAALGRHVGDGASSISRACCTPPSPVVVEGFSFAGDLVDPRRCR